MSTPVVKQLFPGKSVLPVGQGAGEGTGDRGDPWMRCRRFASGPCPCDEALPLCGGDQDFQCGLPVRCEKGELVGHGVRGVDRDLGGGTVEGELVPKGLARTGGDAQRGPEQLQLRNGAAEIVQQSIAGFHGGMMPLLLLLRLPGWRSLHNSFQI